MISDTILLIIFVFIYSVPLTISCMLAIPGIAGLLGGRWKWSSDSTLRERMGGVRWLVVFISTFYLMFAGLPLMAAYWLQRGEDSAWLSYGAAVVTVWMLCILIGRLPIRWFCCHCGKRLSSNEPWLCGFCDRENRFNTFLDRCTCGASAPAFLCPHCGNPTTLVENGDIRHPARAIPKLLPGETDDEARARRAKEIADKKHEIDRLEQEAKIKELEMKLMRFTYPPKTDPKAQRGQWLKDQMDALHLNLAMMAQSMEHKRRAIKEIEANASYSPEEKQELIDYVTDQCQGFQEDIKDGRAGRQ